MKKAVFLLTFFTFLAFFSLVGKAQISHPNFVDDYLEDWSDCSGISEFNNRTVIDLQVGCGTNCYWNYSYYTQHKVYLARNWINLPSGASYYGYLNYTCLESQYIKTTTTFPVPLGIQVWNVFYLNFRMPYDVGYIRYDASATDYLSPFIKIMRPGKSKFLRDKGNVQLDGFENHTTNITIGVENPWYVSTHYPYFYFKKLLLFDRYGMRYDDKKEFSPFKIDKRKIFSNTSGVSYLYTCPWPLEIEYDGTYYYLKSDAEPNCTHGITIVPTHNLTYWEFGLRIQNKNPSNADIFTIGVSLENGEQWEYKIYNNDPNGKIELRHYIPSLDVWEIVITYTTTRKTVLRNTKWNGLSIAYLQDNKLRLYVVEGEGGVNVRNLVSEYSLNSKATNFYFWHFNEAQSSNITINEMGIYEFGVSSVCGNGICEPGEVVTTCPIDCPGYCGDGICNSYYENSITCRQDCGNLTHCGNGICEPEYNETYWNCPQDCPLIQVSECFDITEPGYYYFSGVVKPESPEEVICIRIRASNVVLDMGDYGVDCTKSEGFGIMILGTDTSFNENVTVKNGFVKNCQVGIYIWHMRNVTLSNIDILMDEEVYRDIFPNKSTQIIGLYLWGVENSSFNNIYIERARDGVYLQYYYPPFTDIYTYIKSSVFNDVRVKWAGRYGFTLFDTVESSYFYDCKVDDSIIGFFCGPCYNSTILKSKFYGSTTGIRLTSNSKYNLIAYSEANKLTLDMGTKSNLVCSFVGEIVDKGNNTVRPICTEFLEVPGLNVTVAPPPYLTPLFVPSGLEILEFLFTPFFFLTLGALGVSGLVTYFTGNPVVFGISMLAFIIALSILGVYPLWFSIILGIVILAIVFVLYKGGGYGGK